MGNLRYKLYYSKYFKFLIRSHIFEQITYRVDTWADQDCYWNGSCRLCGCDTPQLFMANKSCKNPCYPTMMNKTKWHEFIYMGWVYKDESGIWCMEDNKPKLLSNVKTFSDTEL